MEPTLAKCFLTIIHLTSNTRKWFNSWEDTIQLFKTHRKSKKLQKVQACSIDFLWSALEFLMWRNINKLFFQSKKQISCCLTIWLYLHQNPKISIFKKYYNICASKTKRLNLSNLVRRCDSISHKRKNSSNFTIEINLSMSKKMLSCLRI